MVVRRVLRIILRRYLEYRSGSGRQCGVATSVIVGSAVVRRGSSGPDDVALSGCNRDVRVIPSKGRNCLCATRRICRVLPSVSSYMVATPFAPTWSVFSVEYSTIFSSSIVWNNGV